MAEIRFHWNRFLSDISEHLLAVTVVVRRPTTQHLVEQGTQTPPVSTPGVTRAFNDFGSKILRGSAETVSLIRLLNTLLRKPEVGNSNVALSIQEYVFWL